MNISRSFLEINQLFLMNYFKGPSLFESHLVFETPVLGFPLIFKAKGSIKWSIAVLW